MTTCPAQWSPPYFAHMRENNASPGRLLAMGEPGGDTMILDLGELPDRSAPAYPLEVAGRNDLDDG